jgi:anti-anti-sigma factor
MRTGSRRESPGGCDVHDHIAWVFDKEADWAAAATTFVAEGVARGERVYYGACGSVAERRDDLADLPDRDALIASDALQIFDAGVIARASYAQRETLIRSAIDQALTDGCPGVRFAVDSTNVAPGGNWDVQAGWERRSDRLCQSLPLTALCGVNRSVVGDEDIARIACMHPTTGGGGAPGPFSLFAVDGGLALSGEIDATVAEELERALVHDEPQPGESVLDLSRVGFVDGRGISTIAGRADRVGAAGGTLLITGAAPMVRRLWELCGFEFHPAVRMVEERPV